MLFAVNDRKTNRSFWRVQHGPEGAFHSTYPTLSTLKISELEEELRLYGIDVAGLSEKQDLLFRH